MLTTRSLYLLGRAGATFTSLALAFTYSRDLGPVNRSAIAIIMTTNALLWIAINSGATLTLRKIGLGNVSKALFGSFLSTIFFHYLFISLSFIGVLLAYSSFKNAIPLNLLILSLLYLTTSGFHLVSMELLVSSHSFKTAGILEFTTVTAQVFLYYFLKSIDGISTASSLLLALSLSYIMIGVFVLSRIHTPLRGKWGVRDPRSFLSESRHNYLLGASLGIMDRVDRILIGFLLATPLLGIYAVSASLIALLRFIPDAISKLVLAQRATLRTLSNLPITVAGPIVILFSMALVIASRKIVNYWFGPEWVLGLMIYFSIAAQELLRGTYQIFANKIILKGQSALVNKSAIYLPVVGVSLALVLTKGLGLLGTPIAFAVAYVVGILILFKENHE
jgi:O-antigen/teichoic acid export membrane protein